MHGPLNVKFCKDISIYSINLLVPILVTLVSVYWEVEAAFLIFVYLKCGLSDCYFLIPSNVHLTI